MRIGFTLEALVAVIKHGVFSIFLAYDPLKVFVVVVGFVAVLVVDLRLAVRVRNESTGNKNVGTVTGNFAVRTQSGVEIPVTTVLRKNAPDFTVVAIG